LATEGNGAWTKDATLVNFGVKKILSTNGEGNGFGIEQSGEF